MAGNKVTTKNKGKEDKGKGSKIVPQTSEDNEELDFTLLRKPVMTSITGFAQARKIFDLATEELKDLLTNECDLLYECKVCRNIFRSLVNFISHKRIYCQEKFNSTIHGHFIDPVSTVNEIHKIKRTEEEYQESLLNKKTKATEDEEDDRIPMSKDLTEVVERMTRVKGIVNNEEPRVLLQKIPSSTIAVFQNLDVETGDNMRSQVSELENILSRDKAVLQSDGKFTIESSKDEHVIQISDDDENYEGGVLKCRTCDLQFSTQKTLKFHMKNKHLESRLVYPCPDCLEIFSTSWSVYRHLFKVHRKTAAQIRRLRESIQSKAFRMNNPPAFYEKRKTNTKLAAPQKMSEEERLDQENQAWMENLEGAGEGACCGGCGRAFLRRAALLAHTHTCHPRTKALALASRMDTKKIEIQIRKDYNKGPQALSILKGDSSSGNTITNENSQPEKKSEQEADKDVEEEKDPLDDAPMDVDEEQSNDSAESPEKGEDIVHNEIKPAFRLPFAMQAEKSNLAAFRQRIQPDIDSSKLLCKKCDTKHSSISELYRHMADHYKWIRYSCKLCNFKHYNFDNLPEHVRVVHKLKGDSDFYFSTVKAIDGTEAMIISRCLVESETTEEANEPSETSPESRRPSRCSSDSSRLSDDSSSSSNLKETGSRKRKVYQAKTGAKRKKETNNADEGEDQKERVVSLAKVLKSIIGGKESPSTVKGFEENSSDTEDIEEKITKKHAIQTKTPATSSRRPVRKRNRPKNEDFEYDLSNILKMEAQGYRETRESRSEVLTTKTNLPKKKTSQESPVTFDINKDYCGALVTLSKKAVEASAAHMKTHFPVSVPKGRTYNNVFARPMLPKILCRGDKASPRKEVEEVKDNSSPNKVPKATENVPVPVYKEKKDDNQPVEEQSKSANNINVRSLRKEKPEKINHEPNLEAYSNISKSSIESFDKDSESIIDEKSKSNRNISAVVPLKFRRQSLELMKNPIINQNITDFSKAGMKTKILVIKPINRNKDGTSSSNTSLKFQTIKLKEPSLGLSNDDNKQSDQVVVVKVPKVDCNIPRSATETHVTNCEKTAPALNSNNTDSSSVSDYLGVDKESEDEVTIPESNVENKETLEAISQDDNSSDTRNEIDRTEISTNEVENSEIYKTT